LAFHSIEVNRLHLRKGDSTCISQKVSLEFQSTFCIPTTALPLSSNENDILKHLLARRSQLWAVVCSVIEQWHCWEQRKEDEVSIDPQTKCETYWEASSNSKKNNWWTSHLKLQCHSITSSFRYQRWICTKKFNTMIFKNKKKNWIEKYCD
jgi:hypothetical protein